MKTTDGLPSTYSSCVILYSWHYGEVHKHVINDSDVDVMVPGKGVVLSVLLNYKIISNVNIGANNY